MQYLAALDAEDFDTIDALWKQVADDADLEAMLHGLNAELVPEEERQETEAVTAAVLGAIEQQMPSAKLARKTGPVTAAEVAERIRQCSPAGFSADKLSFNDRMRKATDEVPTQLGISDVIRWGARFGKSPDGYWQAFREAALDLSMEREPAANYRLAARPQRPKKPGDKNESSG
jgi:hypothetical protein